MPSDKRHEIVHTRNGTLAMRSIEAGEIMHPGVGPLVEAEQLYVRQSRLRERLRESGTQPLVVFDVGLGAGSNAVCARNASEQSPSDAARLILVSFEYDLGALSLALTQPSAFGLDGDAGIAARALLTTGQSETARTTWQLRHCDLLTSLAAEPTHADIVFWDPFSPRQNPLLWTVAAFSAIRHKAAPHCTLFTYSASTTTRVAMLLAGWAVGIGAPIGDKAQTTAAALSPKDLARPLDRTWLSRLSRSDAPLPSDAPTDAAARISQLPQFHRSIR